MMNIYRTHISPPTPQLTEKNLPKQAGKVFIVTGGSSGVGEQLATILYAAHARVYIAARSTDKIDKAIEGIKAAHADSTGSLVALKLDLSDLATIKASADTFLAAESRLDVLWLNAGVMVPPQGSKSAQGWELQLGTNNLGHFLFTRYLTPRLAETAKTAPADSVRVVWVSSSAADLAPKPPVVLDNINYDKKDESAGTKYARSKAGNVLHSCEFARRHGKDGILSVALNPGNLQTDLQRHMGRVTRTLIAAILHPPIYGAYTELYAGLSQDLSAKDHSGAWLQPWGRVETLRTDLADEKLGGEYWRWTEEQVKDY